MAKTTRVPKRDAVPISMVLLHLIHKRDACDTSIALYYDIAPDELGDTDWQGEIDLTRTDGPWEVVSVSFGKFQITHTLPHG
jgi:hypothetical protein